MYSCKGAYVCVDKFDKLIVEKVFGTTSINVKENKRAGKCSTVVRH